MNESEDKALLREGFDFKEVPVWYPLCYNRQCPLQTQCLRYQALLYAPSDLGARLCVMPSQLRDGQCRYFAEIRLVTWARGFSRLYDRVLKADFTEMRKSLVAYFHGKRQYYWYLRGERPLSPEQQAWLKEWLRQWSYEWEFPFDSFEQAYIYHRESSSIGLHIVDRCSIKE